MYTSHCQVWYFRDPGVSLAAAQASAVWLFALSVPVALIGALGAWRVAGATAEAP